MSGVAVVTDSTSSLAATARRHQVVVVPLQVVIDRVSRPESAAQSDQEPDQESDREPGTVRPADVAQALRSGTAVTTSRPSPEAFARVYRRLAAEGYDAVVSVHLSSAVSGTVDAAALAAPDAPIPVVVVDAGTVGIATGFAALAGAAPAARGAGAEEVARVVERTAAASTTYFCVGSLEHLRRGGRIGAAAALVGAALAVKPLLTVENGSVRPYERVRTTARAHARLGELGLAALAAAAEQHERVDVAVHHLDDAEAAEALAARLRAALPPTGELVVAELSAVLAVHVGPGTLGVVISPRLPPAP